MEKETTISVVGNSLVGIVLLIGLFWGPPIWRYIDSLAICHGGK